MDHLTREEATLLQSAVIKRIKKLEKKKCTCCIEYDSNENLEDILTRWDHEGIAVKFIKYFHLLNRYNSEKMIIVEMIDNMITSANFAEDIFEKWDLCTIEEQIDNYFHFMDYLAAFIYKKPSYKIYMQEIEKKLVSVLKKSRANKSKKKFY